MNKSELAKIDKIAGQEFGYEGEALYTGGNSSNYIGQDGSYDFGGGRSFASEHASGRVFTFTLANGTNADHVVALSPAYYDTIARLTAEGHSDVTAIFDDGVIATDAGGDLTATSVNSKKSIYGFLAFVKRNPLRVVKMDIQSNNAAMFDQIIQVENVSPLYDLGNKNIILSQYRPASQLATDKIEADLIATGNVLDFNDQNLIKLPIKTGHTITVNLYIGAIDNRPLKLKNKASVAHENIRRYAAKHCK